MEGIGHDDQEGKEPGGKRDQERLDLGVAQCSDEGREESATEKSFSGRASTAQVSLSWESSH
jgi:hypothetical protein